jgi:hypothetical protein
MRRSSGAREMVLMKRAFKSRNSPAIVIAIFALVAAVAGSAIAGPPTSRKLTKSKVRKIADKEIVKKAPGLTVGKANGVTKGGVTQGSMKGSFVLNLDFGNLAANTCQTLFPSSPVNIADADAIITTPPRNTPPIGTVTQTVNFAPSLAIEACNVTAAPIDPAAGGYRFVIIGG